MQQLPLFLQKVNSAFVKFKIALMYIYNNVTVFYSFLAENVTKICYNIHVVRGSLLKQILAICGKK